MKKNKDYTYIDENGEIVVESKKSGFASKIVILLVLCALGAGAYFAMNGNKGGNLPAVSDEPFINPAIREIGLTTISGGWNNCRVDEYNNLNVFHGVDFASSLANLRPTSIDEFDNKEEAYFNDKDYFANFILKIKYSDDMTEDEYNKEKEYFQDKIGSHYSTTIKEYAKDNYWIASSYDASAGKVTYDINLMAEDFNLNDAGLQEVIKYFGLDSAYNDEIYAFDYDFLATANKKKIKFGKFINIKKTIDDRNGCSIY